MNKLKKKYQVIISGGGPVGLFLAIALQQKGINCVILEKRTKRITHSRSLGIHPVSLELMENIGAVDSFLQAGTKVEKGVAYRGKEKIGTLSFETCPGPYRFVLTLPQFKTEELLEKHLHGINNDALIRGAELVGLNEKDKQVDVAIRSRDGNYTLTCDYLVGCDGKSSSVRTFAGFSFEGSAYPDTYIMGDFSDNTVFGTKAAIFLCREGLVESFPLSKSRRRWVVKTDTFIKNVERLQLEKRIAQRIGHDISEQENYMLSSFGVQKYIADPMARRRIFLAGDAAHILSPIGGQGMNLGWIDAWELTDVLKGCIDQENELSRVAENYSSRRTRAARQAIRRAELNMSLGRKTNIPLFRNTLVWLMLKTPLRNWMAQIFTMRGLNQWPV